MLYYIYAQSATRRFKRKLNTKFVRAYGINDYYNIYIYIMYLNVYYCVYLHHTINAQARLLI